MKQPNGKIIARSVGYRVGKNHPLDRPDRLGFARRRSFSRIFVQELVPGAEAGYEAGLRFTWSRAHLPHTTPKQAFNEGRVKL